jgi:acetyltransferase-like isoleucine patch superfamily enzyme
MVQFNSVVAHDVCIGKNSLISNGACIGEGIKIEYNCFIAMGVKIGCNSIIGKGSVTYKDVPGEVIALGNPARVEKIKIIFF